MKLKSPVRHTVCRVHRYAAYDMLRHPSKDMTLKQIRSRDTIPWIFLKRKSISENKSASNEFFQVPVEALLKLDKLEEYDVRKIQSDSLICFLNQLQFIRLKAKNNMCNLTFCRQQLKF